MFSLKLHGWLNSLAVCLVCKRNVKRIKILCEYIFVFNIVLIYILFTIKRIDPIWSESAPPPIINRIWVDILFNTKYFHIIWLKWKIPDFQCILDRRKEFIPPSRRSGVALSKSDNQIHCSVSTHNELTRINRYKNSSLSKY